MDVYKYHKLALQPLFCKPKEGVAELTALPSLQKKELCGFIRSNGLSPMWNRFLKNDSGGQVFSQEIVEQFAIDARVSAVSYLQQKYVLNTIVELFAKMSVVYAIFKGCHLREIIYSQPAFRPAVDIDILISSSAIEKVIKILLAAGFTLHVKQQNVSHEVSLTFRNVTIDLHWHLLRPGRLRTSVTDTFLETRRDYGSHIGFDEETTLFTMLVHPVFTKYSTTANASLVRFADMREWLKQRPVNWDRLYALLETYGMCTAAWITATYFGEVTGERLPKIFLQRIMPGKVQQRYLEKWVQADWASRISSTPILTQFLFTLPAHDTVSDALHFLGALVREKCRSQKEAASFLAMQS